MKRGRGYRRFQHERCRRKALCSWNVQSMESVFSLTQVERARLIGRHAATPKPCSCWMCGNPRRFGEPTPSERVADLEAREQQPEQQP